MFKQSNIVKTEEQIAKIRESAHLVAETIKHVEKMVRPGVTPLALSNEADRYITARGGYPAFKGYKVGRQTFRHAACTSINEAVVHGIPNEEPLKEGDILSFDVGVEKDGWFGDGAWTFAVGEISKEKQQLLDVTRESLLLAVRAAKAGNKLFDISRTVQEYCEASGYGVVRELVGHGIGRHLHEDPQVPNYVPSRMEGIANMELVEGMTLAIEPMINMGTHYVKTAADKWTVITADGMPSAHFEHTIVVRKDGGEILTA